MAIRLFKVATDLKICGINFYQRHPTVLPSSWQKAGLRLDSRNLTLATEAFPRFGIKIGIDFQMFISTNFCFFHLNRKILPFGCLLLIIRFASIFAYHLNKIFGAVPKTPNCSPFKSMTYQR